MNQQELPREPKFYPNEIVTNGVSRKVVIPTKERITYEVNDNGIMEVVGTFDQHGEPIHAKKNMVIPKEVFVEAYKKYIEDGD